MTRTPYGSWPSRVRAEDAAAVAGRFDGVDVDGTDVYWLEHRPRQGGRSVVFRMTAGGDVREVAPASFDVGSRAYGYGGGAWTVRAGSLYAVNLPDGRVYRIDPGRPPMALTPPGDGRYGDLSVSPDGTFLTAVRDGDHAEVVTIPTGGGGAVRSLFAATFCAAPRIDPSGRRLAWLTWDHPDMPWDRTRLLVAEFGADGNLGPARIVAGGDESLVQPQWSDDGVLHVVSDRTGWWNLYRWDATGLRAVAPGRAEFAVPPWTLGNRCYDFLPGRRIACVYGVGAYRKLGVIDRDTGRLSPIQTTATWISPRIGTLGDRVWCVAADPATPPRLTEFPAGAGAAAESGRGWRPGGTGTHLAVPRPVEFATRDGATGYGLYYPPTNPDVTAPAGPPPLVVNCHGGPTGAVSSQYQADLQFFATRGLAVLDIDYAGSAGYGRDYRRRLAGAWGVRDVADCVDGARALAERGLADPDRLVIRGASAGGYTALAAVTFTDAFAAATSYYGISDLNALAQETHRFESHYAEGLLGGPPGHPAYRERSPLHHLDRLRRPVLLLHGSADTIVPANQARAIADRLNAIGVPHELVEFPGEGHGFRDAGTVSTALRTELAFYGRVLGFTPAEPLSPEAVAR